MEGEAIFSSVIRWVHILSAIGAVGGTFFIRVVLGPAAKAALEDEAHAALREKVLGRWRPIVHSCIGLLLGTGMFNALLSMMAHQEQGLYHGLLGTKVLLAMVVFALAIAVTDSRKGTGGGGRLMVVSLVLAAVVVLLSAILAGMPTTS